MRCFAVSVRHGAGALRGGVAAQGVNGERLIKLER
jgi:hypothetical protein